MGEHPPHDAVGPQAVLDDLGQARVELPGDVVELPAGLLVDVVPRLVEDLLHLLRQLARDLREVLDEVEGVLDLVGDPGRQLPEGGQLFLEHHLVLRPAKVAQHPFELDVLGPHLLGEHLDQVEPLDLEGVLAEDLERVGHVGHLVVPADVHGGLEVPPRHPAHRGREARDPAHQHPAHEEPADEHEGHDADHVEGKEEHEPEVDGRFGIGRRDRRSVAGGGDDALRGGHELPFQAPVAREVLLLEADQAKLVLPQAECAVPLPTELHQLPEARLEVRVLDVPPPARHVSRHRIELLAEGADEVRIRDLERLAEQALREARLRAQGEEAAVAGQLPVGSVFFGRGGGAVEGPVPGREEQDLVVDHREQDGADRAPLLLDLGGHGQGGAVHLDPPFHRPVDPVGVLEEARRDPVQLLQQLLAHLHPPHGAHDLREFGAMDLELRARLGELLTRAGGDEAGHGGNQERAPLREQEGGVEVGDAALGDPALRVADVLERVEPDEARGEREREGPAEAEVELPGDPESVPAGAGGGGARVRSGALGGSRGRGARGGRGDAPGGIGGRGFVAHRSARAASRSMGR